MSSTSRRSFLRHSAAASTLISTGTLTVPSFLAQSARAADNRSSSTDRVLVVVQLLGGNDGLNTVIPHNHDGYLRGRRALRLPSAQVLKVTDDIGLHPGMGQAAKLLENGRLSIIQGVGYPNPDRSHFRSMEIWETARPGTVDLDTGWLGRVLDAHPAPAGADLPALNVGNRRSLALEAESVETPALESLDQYRLRLTGDAAERQARRDKLSALAATHTRTSSPDPLLGFVRRTTLAALDSSLRLEQVAETAKTDSGTYPRTGLGRRLELLAHLIKAGFGTRIYYTSLDGFDTHANQLAAHAGLLTEWSDAVAAFHADLENAGQADRAAVLTFSEFGRRVSENASAGTDHGAAAPVFVSGPVAHPGLIGDHPSFATLDDGDLTFHTDFRRVYATLLESWLNIPAPPILGTGFEPLDLFASRA
jgi:uncharacterized protein (DUF1501 family)